MVFKADYIQAVDLLSPARLDWPQVAQVREKEKKKQQQQQQRLLSPSSPPPAVASHLGHRMTQSI